MSKQFNTISEAYMAVLHELYTNYEHLNEGTTYENRKKDNQPDPLLENKCYYFNRGETKEKMGYVFTIVNPKRNDPIVTKSTQRNKIIAEYAEKERKMYDEGDIHNMAKISRVWDIIKNPDGTVNANYGYMVYHIKDAGNPKYDDQLMSQWEWAKARLKLNKSTCQAYLHFNRPKDQWTGNLDQPCTMFIQFVIRNDRLSLYGYMRSNDIVYGTPYNILYFIELLYRMHEELIETYPSLKIGSYTHNTTSLHYYTKHEDKVKDMLGLLT